MTQLTGMKPLTLEVFNPQGQTARPVHHELAPRVKDLNGKTIGLMCNWLTGQVEDFANFKKVLNARFSNLKFVEWRSEATAPLDEKGIAEVVGPAKRCDAVIGFTAL